MKGDQEIIDALNVILTGELTAINQYFLHARMLEDWGLGKIGKLEYEASIDEMKHADQLIKRILFLNGLPNLQRYEKINIGQNVEEIFESDLKLEYAAVINLKTFIKLAEDKSDFVSRDLFASILSSEEDHIDWIETQQELIRQVGLERYMQSQIDSEG